VITPTVGRVVWYRPYIQPGVTAYSLTSEDWGYDTDMNTLPGQPLAAHVVAVWGDECVSLAVFDIGAKLHARHSVYLWQGEGERPTGRRYCEWMPFQKGQAMKTEELEKRRPSVQELEAILRSEEKLAVTVQPDGSIRAEPVGHGG
jgi:hypothetical protein